MIAHAILFQVSSEAIARATLVEPAEVVPPDVALALHLCFLTSEPVAKVAVTVEVYDHHLLLFLGILVPSVTGQALACFGPFLGHLHLERVPPERTSAALPVSVVDTGR